MISIEALTETTRIARARDAYANNLITIDQFEDTVDAILRNEDTPTAHSAGLLSISDARQLAAIRNEFEQTYGSTVNAARPIVLA